MGASQRFKAFATQYRGKIRAELHTAMLLLREERFTLAYEQYAAAKQRGPDFTVTFKTHTPFNFNIEVRRRRGFMAADDPAARAARLIAMLCDKVGQMPPSMVNLLWLEVASDMAEAELTLAAMTLRQMAEEKVEAFFRQRGFAHAVAFLKQYRQLSRIVRVAGGAPVIWSNPLARRPTPPAISRAIARLKR